MMKKREYNTRPFTSETNLRKEEFPMEELQETGWSWFSLRFLRSGGLYLIDEQPSISFAAKYTTYE